MTVCATAAAEVTTVNLNSYGIKPGAKNIAARMEKAIAKFPHTDGGDTLMLIFESGRYDFYPDKAPAHELYISNHDQDNPKRVGLFLNNRKNVIIDGQGAEFIFHGRMLPVAVTECSNITLKNFSIDFENPHISQIKVLESDSSGIVFKPEPWVEWRITRTNKFEVYGQGWEHTPQTGIAFEPDTRHMVYRTSDLWTPLDSVIRRTDGTLYSPAWVDLRLNPGTIVALRTYGRPAPGIFLDRDINTCVQNVKVRYAEGMGLLAQLCTDVTLDGFCVCLRGDNDPRYFTTQADATHFSACAGVIDSRNGLYEGMMDDAINVHGTYLKLTPTSSPYVFTGRYMHNQTYGFKWGEPGDSVQIVLSRTMEKFGQPNVIESIEPADSPSEHGAKEFRITLRNPVKMSENVSAGLENLRWTPRVIFADNIVRNNRARGTLFSTPRQVVVENNLFDHTSGSAILLCGDCNGWFETGACRDIMIRGNRFVNALTNQFQFTEAVISIYPEIPELDAQQQYFHGGADVPGVIIKDNDFEIFDAPVLFAKSIDGLRFTNNRIHLNRDYIPYHPNKYTYRIQHSKHIDIDSNTYHGVSPSFKAD